LTPGVLKIIKLESMPTYEYVCEKCGHHFEKFQPISAQPLTVCPKEACLHSRWGKGKVSRVISGGAGLIFKGSGFYITDYRSESYKEAAKKESAGKSSSGAATTTAGGGDNKPAAKTAESKPDKAPAAKT
jgi:putative FmdB family regulatory protein